MYDDVDVENSVSRMGSDYLQEKQDVSCPRGHLINSWTSSSSPMMMITWVLKTRLIEKKYPSFLFSQKWPFPHSQFGHFQCPKQKSKTTSQ